MSRGHLDRLPFRQAWAVDFEYMAPPGEWPAPVCLVAKELRSGELIRVWQDELHRMRVPPYPTGADVLFIAYFASAELGCHLVFYFIWISTSFTPKNSIIDSFFFIFYKKFWKRCRRPAR